ncbi:MAG: CIA30 family protein [Bradymonadia bacterium]
MAELDWTVVNDTVMGGVSTSSVVMNDGVLHFTGKLSLEQNGGFTSIRSQPLALPLANARALRITVRGDGRRYDLTLRRSDVPLRAGSYRVKIPTTEKATTLEIPLSDFRPSSFGRAVHGAPALDAVPERIESIGFLLADKNPGPFRLEVLSIEAVPGAEPRGPGHAGVVADLRAAIAEGVPAFNRGEPGHCRLVYATALTTALGQGSVLTPGERSIVTQALSTARRQSDTEAAWTLRHAIDTVLAAVR